MFTHTKTTHYNLWSTWSHIHITSLWSTCSHKHKPHITIYVHLFTHITVGDPPVHTHYSQWSTCSHTSQPVIHLFTHITASDPPVHTHHSQWSTCSHTYTHTQQPVTITSSHITPHYKLTYVFTHIHRHTHTSSTLLHVTHMFTHMNTPTPTHTSDPPVHTHKPYNTTCSSSCNQYTHRKWKKLTDW